MNRLKELRESRHLTQIALGLRVHTTQQCISKYERNICNIPADMLRSIAEYFHVTTDYILGVSDIRQSPEIWRQLRDFDTEKFDVAELYGELNAYERRVVTGVIDVLFRQREENGEMPVTDEKTEKAEEIGEELTGSMRRAEAYKRKQMKALDEMRSRVEEYAKTAKEEGRIEVIIQMLENGLDHETVARILNTPPKEIKKLKDKWL